MTMNTLMPAPAVLPTASQLPAVSPYLATLGQNPYAPTNFTAAGSANPFTLPSPSLANSLQQRVTMSALANAGMPMDGDPNAWTPEMAAQQTAGGIAKLASVNPELAQQLADKWQGGEGDSDGGGIWGSLSNLAGDLLHPVMSSFGKALDYLGRAANIVPNIAFDMADGGGFSLGDDVGGAISGNVRHNWNGVFQEMGWDGGGLSGFVRAGLGLVGDIATDPLTWLIPAGKLLKAGESSGLLSKELAVKAIASHSYEGAALVAKETGMNLAQHVDEYLNMAGRVGVLNGEKFGAEMVEAYAGRMSVGVQDGLKGVLADASEIQAKAYLALSKGDTGLFKAGSSIFLDSGRSVTGETLKTAAQELIHSGTGSSLMKNGLRLKGEAKAAWDLAQLAKSSLGGLRTGVQIPFTTFRYITPFSFTFGKNLPFTAARRFFSGYSGIQKLIGAAEHADTPEMGQKLWNAALKWQEGGWTKFKAEASPDIVDALKGRGGSMASGFRAASEEMGRLTLRFDPWGAARSGIMGYYSKAAENHARSLAAEFSRDTMGSIEVEGKTYHYGHVLQRVEKDFQISKRAKYDTASEEVHGDVATWLDEMPWLHDAEGNTVVLTGDQVDLAFWARPENKAVLADAAGDASAPELAAAKLRLERLKAVDAKLSAQQKGTLDMYRRIWGKGREEAARHDVFTHDVMGEYNHSGLIHRARVKHWQAGTAESASGTGETVLYITPKNAAHGKTLRSHGITSDAVDSGYVDGIQLHSKKLTDDDVEVAVRGGNWVGQDKSPGAAFTDQDLLDTADLEAKAGRSRVPRLTQDSHGIPVGAGAVDDSIERSELAAMRREYLQRSRPDSSGVFTKNADGTYEMVVFDFENVKVLSDSAPMYHSAGKGFFHRQFSGKLQEFLRGVPDFEGKVKLLKQVGDPESLYPRELSHLSLEESAEAVRDALAKRGLKYDGPVWNTNILDVHDTYVRRLSRDIAAEHIGQVGRRMTAMMDLSPGMLGHPIARQRFEWDIPLGVQKSLAKGEKRVMNAVAREAKNRARLDEAEHTSISRAVDRYLGLEAAVAEGLGTEETGHALASVRLRRVIDTTADVKVALNDERRVAQEAHDSAAESLARSSAARDEMDAANKFERTQVPVPDRRVETGTPPEGTPERRGNAFDRGETLEEAVARRVEEKPSFEVVPEDGKFRVKSKDYADRESFSRKFDTEAEAAAYAKQANESVARTMELSVRESLPKDVGRYAGPPDVPVYEATYFDDLAAKGEVWRNPGEGGALGELVTSVGKKRGAVRIQPVEVEAARVVEFQSRLDELRDLEKTLFKGTDLDTPMPVLGPRTVKKLAKQGEQAASATEAVVGQARRAADDAEVVSRILTTRRSQLQQAVVERNRAYSALRGGEARAKPVLRPVERGLEGWTPLHIRGLEGLAMPHYVAAEFHHIVDQHGVQGIRKMWREHVLNWWKRWATYRWPGFHVRNFFGAFFNNVLGGVGLMHDSFAWRVGRRSEELVDPKHFKRFNLAKLGFDDRVTYGNISDFLSHEGIGRANTTAVAGVMTAADELEGELAGVGKGRGPLNKAWRAYDRKARDYGSGIENFHRTAAWARGMEVTNGDIWGARDFVMMRHGDYDDLTSTEDVVRDVIPFYKWMRTNTPYQIRMLVENPAAMTLPNKLVDFAYAAQGLDRKAIEADMPDWMKKDSMAIPLPKLPFGLGSDTENGALSFALMDLPYTDLYKGLTDYMSSALPMVKNIGESYGFKKSLFTGAPLEGKMVPLSGVWAAVPGVPSILSAVGIAHKGADGKLYIKDQVENILSAWPVYSRFRNFMLSDDSRVEYRVGSVLSMFAGLPVRASGAEEAAANDVNFFYQEIAPVIQQYKDMGVTFPTADEFTAAGLSFDRADSPSAETFAPSGVIAPAPLASVAA